MENNNFVISLENANLKKVLSATEIAQLKATIDKLCVAGIKLTIKYEELAAN
jgi:hypothetical protein